MLVSNAAVTNRTTVFALMLLIGVAGVYSYLTLPRESNPDITIPNVLVVTPYEGVAPEDVESLVTIPIERKLKGLKDVEALRSVSAEGASMITIEFSAEVDIDDALQKVRDKVDQAKGDLPTDLEADPVIQEINLSEFPVLMVAVSGSVGERVLKAVAEQLEDRIEEIPGVLAVDLTGTRERQIRVEFDPDRMAAYRLSFSEILRMIQRENVTTPGGSIDLGRGKYLLRVPGEFTDPGVIDSLVVTTRDGRPIYLKDIATVQDTFEDRQSRARLNGRESVTLAVKKRTGENIIAVSDQVFALLDQARPLLPEGVEFSITLNESKDIRRMVRELENNIITGLLLVVAVLFLFLGTRNALFVALAIPFSMLLSFTVLQALGVTLNMVVLFSLILALGMLVDNAIVIVESTYRHLEEGKAPLDAARTAAAEVGWPVISSTLTTLCAFGPMLFWPGIMGEFMGFLPLTLIVVLTSSLFVALVINPVLCATFMQGLPRSGPAAPGRLLRGYGKLLQVSLRWRGSVLALAILSVAGLVALYGRFGNGVEFFPESDPNRAVVEIEAPQGTNLATTDGLARAVEAVLADEPDLKYRIAEVGVSEEGSSGVESRRARVSVEFVERGSRREPSPVVIDRIRERLSGIAGAAVTVGEEEMGPPTGAPVEVEIRGADVAVLGELVERAKARIQGVPGLVDLEDDLSRANPEIRVVVDRERATLLGLSTAEVSNTVKAAIAGTKVGTYREGEDEFDIVARLPETQRQGFADIERLLVPTQGGDPVPLSSVARLEMGTGFGSIRHLDQKRLARVTANVAGRNANEVLAEVRERLAGLELPAGTSIAFAGESEDQAEAAAFLSKAFVIALFGIALILLTQFNSVAQAGIVLTSVILSLTGVFFGLLVTGMPFGIIMTGIGVVSLAGVVVNNAIVLIDTINQLRREGLALHDALVRAGVVRFRPVLLTAITTILGMLPMALGMGFDFYTLSVQVGGESAQWWSPLAVAVIFGLAVATLLTLVVVPVLYSLSETVSLRRLVPSRRWFPRRAGSGGQFQPIP